MDRAASSAGRFLLRETIFQAGLVARSITMQSPWARVNFFLHDANVPRCSVAENVDLFLFFCLLS